MIVNQENTKECTKFIRSEIIEAARLKSVYYNWIAFL